MVSAGGRHVYEGDSMGSNDVRSSHDGVLPISGSNLNVVVYETVSPLLCTCCVASCCLSQIYPFPPRVGKSKVGAVWDVERMELSHEMKFRGNSDSRTGSYSRYVL